MANTSFKVENGLLVEGNAQFDYTSKFNANVTIAADQWYIGGNLYVTGTQVFVGGNVAVADILAGAAGLKLGNSTYQWDGYLSNAYVYGTLLNPVGNTVQLGNSTNRWVISGNSLNISTTSILTGAATLSNTITVTGATTLSNTLAVTGTSTLTGNATLSGTLQTISGNAAFNTSTLFVDATNNRVGIGTTTPDTTLKIQGSFAANGTANFANTVAVTGNTSLSNTLTVTGNATFSNVSTFVGNVTFSNTTTFNNDVLISANLTVTGTRTYVNTQTLDIGDNIITLNADVPGATAPTENAGIEINRGSSANSRLQWTESTAAWQLSSGSVSTFYNIVNEGTSNTNLDSGTLFVDAVNNRVGINNTAPGVALRVTGATDISSTANVQGNANVGGTLGVTGAANALSTLGVNGLLTAAAGLTVTGTTNTSVGLNVGGGLAVTNGVSITNTSIAVGNTTANATHAYNLIQASNSTSTANLTPSTLTIGTTTVNGSYINVGTLFVTGVGNVQSTFGMAGAANALSTLGVNGLLTAAAGLTVTGTANVSTNLNVTGTGNVQSTFGIAGAANALSTFGVTGAANALSTLGVNGLLTAAAGLTVTGTTNTSAQFNVGGGVATTNGATITNTSFTLGNSSVNTQILSSYIQFNSTATGNTSSLAQLSSSDQVGGSLTLLHGNTTSNASVIIGTQAGNNGVIEIGGTTSAFIDFKVPFADDFDTRLQSNTSGFHIIAGSSTSANVLNILNANVNIDSGTLYLDAVNNRVGINNTAPGVALRVTGAADISSTANVQGNANVGGTLGITGAANALSTLGITGAANTLSTLGVNGLLTAAAGLTVTGTTNTSVGLNVGGGLAITNGVSITNTSIAVGNSTANATLAYNLIQASNSTSTANLSPTGLAITTGAISIGSATFVANTTGVYTNNSLYINQNAKSLYFATVNASTYAYFTQQNDDNFVLYSSNTLYGARPIFSVFANSATSNLKFSVRTQHDGGLYIPSGVTILDSTSSQGTQGQVLTSNGTGNVYWSSSGFSSTDDTATNATYYPLVVTSSGGSTAKTSSSKLTYNPSTGTLTATILSSTSANVGTALTVNSTSINAAANLAMAAYTEKLASYTIVANGTQDLDLKLASVFKVSVGAFTANVRFINPPASGTGVSATLILQYTGTSVLTLQGNTSGGLAGTLKYAYDTAPTLTQTNLKSDIVSVITYDGGSTYIVSPSFMNFTT